jgi:hypothetical protein
MNDLDETSVPMRIVHVVFFVVSRMPHRHCGVTSEAWDRRQLPEAIAMIERATSLPRPPVVVVFIHGWKNNADRDERHRNGNVVGFEGVLEYLRQSVYPQSPVIGIYIGWRGDLVPPYWPARRQLSYFNRENAAIPCPAQA